MTAAALIRTARTESGLTQVELAARLGISQAALAKLERPGSNPTVRTLERVLRAAGRQLEMTAPPARSDLDLEQLRRHLKLTPAQRLKLFEASHHNLTGLRPT